MDENPRETQEQELEALRSIYSEDELNVICEKYPNICVEVTTSVESDELTDPLLLRCTFPADYPNVAPKMELEGLRDADAAFESLRRGALAALDKLAAESVGMSMVFTLVAGLQDHVAEALRAQRSDAERVEAQRKADADRLERARFESSRVTVEQFNAWRDKFMAEMRAKKEAEKANNPQTQTDRLTGKQLFLRDKSLNVSDLQFINSPSTADDEDTKAAADVDGIDASLFEDELNDEDLSDSEEDEALNE